jgi:3-hydroxyisobutyrate dehydrogenase-like beta-hydroxyacid dehydrogenase
MRVGFIGLGTMGKAMAANQIKAGFDLIAFDTRREPLDELRALGAKIAGSAQEVGEQADVVGISVRDDAQVDSVVLGAQGLLASPRRDAVVVIHTTCHPDTVRAIGAKAKEKGVGVLDAPVSNGAKGAFNASLCFMVGGDAVLFDRCRPVFAASGRDIIHFGPLGAGATAKLAHQVICLGTLNAVAEGMLLAESTGIDLQTFSEVLRHSSAQSHFAQTWLNRLEERGRDMAAVMCESVDPALRLGRELDVPLSLTALGQQILPARIRSATRSWASAKK